MCILATRTALYCSVCDDGFSQEILTDGTWFWTTEMIHYFEVHNITLAPSFINHIENKEFVFSEINIEDDDLMDKILNRYFQIEKIEENYRAIAHQKQKGFLGLLIQKTKNLFDEGNFI